MTSPGDTCVHWMHYSEATKTREGWARNLLDEFKSNVEMLKSTVRDQQGPAPAHSSPQHGKHTPEHISNVGCLFRDNILLCLLARTHGTSSLLVFCPPVSLRDDEYGPLGNQERAGGVGLREADEGLPEWSSHTQPPVQCCWCLEPGTTVCVRTAGCGDTHLLQGTEVSHWSGHCVCLPLCHSVFIFVSSSSVLHLSFIPYR